ncbi:hypothetical protein LOK49_LG13G00999 [Camellia lanceoleosa]|uniref:Uncharacterized protein n=1 Tax=Camellia lanceoleosa TaxID=1840588 RepID=A0ACC0FGK6_9ERIC|nr:hypothetical protein LOK49_LG13G00999 [Camellia lanceoleosa]
MPPEEVSSLTRKKRLNLAISGEVLCAWRDSITAGQNFHCALALGFYTRCSEDQFECEGENVPYEDNPMSYDYDIVETDAITENHLHVLILGVAGAESFTLLLGGASRLKWMSVEQPIVMALRACLSALLLRKVRILHFIIKPEDLFGEICGPFDTIL